MSNIAAGNVAYTVLKTRTLGDSRKFNQIKIVFGDGALLYPAGGVPITKAKLGLPVTVESLIVIDGGGSGYSFKYDQAGEKLLLYHQGSHVHDIKAKGGLTSSEALLLDASQAFGKNAATDRTIVGSNSANAGGVVAVVPGADVEPTGVAIAAQTLKIDVIGW